MKTTVIIPAYNAERFIAEALDSVFQQTRLPDEIIVVDDCSTDRTCDIVEKYPVKLLQTAKNSGHAAARNIGIEAATGDVIAWLDADDYWEPNHIETVVGLLDKFESAAVAFSAVRHFGDRVHVWNGFPCSDGPRSVFWEAVENTLVPAMSAVTRTEAIRSVGGFDASIRVAPDFDLWLKMSRKFQFVSTERVTSNYRMHAAQISSKAAGRQVRATHEARARLMEHLEKEDPELAGKLRKYLRERWQSRVNEAWHCRDLRKVRELALYGFWAPYAKWPAIRMWCAAALPARAISAWDRLTQSRQ